MVLFIFVYLFFLQTIYLNLFCLIFFAAWTSLCTHRHWGRWQVEVWAHHHLRNCLGPLPSEYYSRQTPQPFLKGAPRSPLIAFGFDWRNKIRLSAPSLTMAIYSFGISFFRGNFSFEGYFGVITFLSYASKAFQLISEKNIQPCLWY